MEQTSIGENSSCFKAIHFVPWMDKFVFFYEIHILLAPRIDKMQIILLRQVIGGKWNRIKNPFLTSRQVHE